MENRRAVTAGAAAAVIVLMFAGAPRSSGQNPQIEQRVAAVKQAAAQNKQALAQYTWVEQQAVSLKGEVKKQSASQVRLGPDGKQQKTPIGGEPAASGAGGRKRGLKAKVVEKKKEEFHEYAERMVSLLHRYAPPDPDLLQQAYQQGNVTFGPTGTQGEIRLVIQNFVKPKDSMTLVLNEDQRSLRSIQISTYLDDPGDAVTLSVQFSELPDGTNHVSTTTLNGVSKQLTVVMQNSNYQKM
jgi:hypothetical protein